MSLSIRKVPELTAAVLALLGLLFYSLPSYAKKQQERIFVADPIPYVDVVLNGVECRLAIDPTFHKFIFLNLDIAKKTGLADPDYPGRVYKTYYDLEGTKIEGFGKIAKLIVFGETVKAEAYYYGRDIINGFDGTIGIGLLKANQITFNFPDHLDKSAEYKQTTIKLKKKNYQWVAYSKSTKLQAKINFHNKFISVNKYVMDKMRSLGDVTLLDEFIFQEVALGFVLPAQAFTLMPDNSIFGDGIKMDDVYVLRKEAPPIEDGSFALKDKKLNEKQIEEIVVIGRSKNAKKKDKEPIFFVGREAFSHCKSIQFDLKAKKLNLFCQS